MPRASCLLLVLALVTPAALAGPLWPADDETEAVDRGLLATAHIGDDTSTLLVWLRARVLTDESRQQLEQRVRQLGSGSFALRREAQTALLAAGVASRPFLRAAVFDPDLEVASRARECLERITRGPGPFIPAAVVRQLVRRRPPEALGVLLAYIPFAEDETVEDEIVNGLLQLASPEGTPNPNLLAALTAELPARREAAGYVLGRSRDASAVDAVKKLLADPDARVRFRTVQGLLAGKERSAVPVLIALLGDAPPQLAWQVEELLYRVGSGQGPPTLPVDDGSDASRLRRRDAWAAWWRAGDRPLDWNAILGDTQPLGLTLIAQMDTGKVWECDRVGKPVWTIDKLLGPIDAQVLPGGLVLVAEYQGRQVTVRTQTGEVRWRVTIDGNPTTCRRLPNGNTFVATYRQVMEFAPDGSVVYRHTPEGGRNNFHAAQKLPDGRIVCINGSGQVIEVDAVSGRTLRQQQLTNGTPYSVEVLPGNRFLVANYSQSVVQEFDATGAILWRHEVPGAYHATRLPNGNTLVSSHAGQKVVEINHAGTVVWQTATNGHVWRVHRR